MPSQAPPAEVRRLAGSSDDGYVEVLEPATLDAAGDTKQRGVPEVRQPAPRPAGRNVTPINGS
jgi:hypothetical protein